MKEKLMFAGKTLMITGGAGSFGEAVPSWFPDTDVREVRIFNRDKKKQEDMRIALSCTGYVNRTVWHKS
jgi:UDP-glucose 4-epimerase